MWIPLGRRSCSPTPSSRPGLVAPGPPRRPAASTLGRGSCRSSSRSASWSRSTTPPSPTRPSATSSSLFIATQFVGWGEEGMFRGIGVTTLRDHGLTEGKVALWSSIIFGAVHLSNADRRRRTGAPAGHRRQLRRLLLLPHPSGHRRQRPELRPPRPVRLLDPHAAPRSSSTRSRTSAPSPALVASPRCGSASCWSAGTTSNPIPAAATKRTLVAPGCSSAGPGCAGGPVRVRSPGRLRRWSAGTGRAAASTAPPRRSRSA